MAAKSKARFARYHVILEGPFMHHRIVAAKLFSTAGTGFTYTLRRPRTAPKFELCKYDPLGTTSALHFRHLTLHPAVGCHVLFTEKKFSAPKP